MEKNKEQAKKKQQEFCDKFAELYDAHEKDVGEYAARGDVITTVIGTFSASFGKEYNLSITRKDSLQALKTIVSSYVKGHIDLCFKGLASVFHEGIEEAAESVMSEISDAVKSGKINGPEDLKKFVKGKLKKLKEEEEKNERS